MLRDQNFRSFSTERVPDQREDRGLVINNEDFDAPAHDRCRILLRRFHLRWLFGL